MENFNSSDSNPILQKKIARIRQWLFGWLVLVFVICSFGSYVQNNMSSMKKSFLAYENRQMILFSYLYRASEDSASVSVISKMFNVKKQDIQKGIVQFTEEQQAAFYENIRIPKIDVSIEETYLSGESNNFTYFYFSLIVFSGTTILLALAYLISHFLTIRQLSKNNYEGIVVTSEDSQSMYALLGIPMGVSFVIMVASLPISTFSIILVLLGGCSAIGMVMHFSSSEGLVKEFKDNVNLSILFPEHYPQENLLSVSCYFPIGEDYLPFWTDAVKKAIERKKTIIYCV